MWNSNAEIVLMKAKASTFHKGYSAITLPFLTAVLCNCWATVHWCKMILSVRQNVGSVNIFF